MSEPNHTLSLPCNVRAEEPRPSPNLWRSMVGSTEFKRFDPAESHALSSVGWDAWAEEYARLPRVNSTYRFSKRQLWTCDKRAPAPRWNSSTSVRNALR